MFKTVDITVDFRRSPQHRRPSLNSTVLAVESFRFLGSTVSQDLKWESNINTQKGPTEDLLTAPAQERQPALGVADPVLHCSHQSLFSAHPSLSGQEQTTMAENIICANLPTIPPIHLQSHGTGRRNHCRPLIPWT